MATRVEVGYRSGVRDPRGERVVAEARDMAGIDIRSVRTVSVYTLDMDLAGDSLEEIASGPLTDPVIQEFSIGRPLVADFDVLIEVGFKPGVTDNVGRSAGEAVAQILGRPLEEPEAVYTSIQYLIEGELEAEEAERLASQVLANELIHRWQIVFPHQFDPARGLDAEVPRVSLAGGGEVAEVDLEGDDEELMKISREGLLALSIEEMKAIQGYFRRPAVRQARKEVGLGERATDLELESLAQTWSEHCKHKIFNARIRYSGNGGDEEIVDSLFMTYIVGATEKIRRDGRQGHLSVRVQGQRRCDPVQR